MLEEMNFLQAARRFASLVLLSTAVMATSCSASSNDGDAQAGPRPASVEATPTPVGDDDGDAVSIAIGPDGGTLTSADGMLRVDVPRGALDSERVLSIRPITNHAHGKIGRAYRLSPDGVTFSVPVRLAFTYTPDEIAGTAPELLRVASQTDTGHWSLHDDVTLDADASTVAAHVRHFSDWSLVTGALLSPGSAIAKPGESIALSVIVCERAPPDDDFLAPLIAACRPSEVFSGLVRNWAVNGRVGGDGSVGTVTIEEDRKARYTAPQTVPSPNPVAVSTEYTALDGAIVTLVANVTVQAGPCFKSNPFEPCRYELVTFEGQGLPYENLPREDWENPEVLMSGLLTLHDSDANGEGTWTLLHVWIEKRPVGDLEQFVRLAGEYTTDSAGRMRFTALGGSSFEGTMQGRRVILNDYPFSTKHTAFAANMTLQLEQ